MAALVSLNPGSLRVSTAVATSAILPAVILVLAWARLLDVRLSLALTLAMTDVRLALLGSAVAWFAGERSSRRMFLAGFGLAIVAAAAAALKWWLTH